MRRTNLICESVTVVHGLASDRIICMANRTVGLYPIAMCKSYTFQKNAPGGLERPAPDFKKTPTKYPKYNGIHNSRYDSRRRQTQTRAYKGNGGRNWIHVHLHIYVYIHIYIYIYPFYLYIYMIDICALITHYVSYVHSSKNCAWQGKCYPSN